MSKELRDKIKGKEMRLFIYVSALLMYMVAFLLATPEEIIQGMKTIRFGIQRGIGLLK